MIRPVIPARGELILIAVFAVALRVAVFCVAIRFGHLSISQYTSKGDTSSYIANAAVMCGERSRVSLDEYDQRVFPGYPVLIAIVHRLGISLPMAALVVTWLSAGVAAAVAGRVFEDARVGWAMTCLIPHYLINSSLGMSEAPLLVVVCLALLFWKKDWLIFCGIAFAFAGMIRPMACFAFAGVLWAMIYLMRFSTPALRSTSEPASFAMMRRIVVLLVASAVMFVLELLAFQLWTGDALRGIHVYSQHPGAYGGHMLAWPFRSLLMTPGLDHAGWGRIVYTSVHVGITLAACVVVAWRAGETAKPQAADGRDLVSLPWLIGNTAFVLCIGSVWGFRHFPRFTIPAAPAMFWTLRKVLPRNVAWWGLIAAACGVMAVVGVIDSP